MTVTVAPERTLEQRRLAIVKANEVRAYRCQLKRDIKTGKASFLTVLASPPWQCETMRVRDLLLAIPMVGKAKADRILWRTRTSPNRTLAGLSDRQRLEIASALRDRGSE